MKNYSSYIEGINEINFNEGISIDVNTIASQIVKNIKCNSITNKKHFRINIDVLYYKEFFIMFDYNFIKEVLEEEIEDISNYKVKITDVDEDEVSYKCVNNSIKQAA